MELASVGRRMILLQLLLLVRVHSFPADETCARLHLKNGSVHPVPVTQMGIGDRQNYEMVETAIIDIVEYTVGAWEWCVLFICGFSPTSNSSWIRQPANYYGGPGKFRAISNPPKDIRAISCGCKMHSCEMHLCENLNQTWEGSECAILYRESTCFSCYYEPVRIGIGDQFTTVPFDIASLLVRPGYKVSAQLSSLENDEGSNYEWSQEWAEVFDIYSRNTDTSTFSCESISKVESPEEDQGNGDEGKILNLNPGVFYGIIGACVGLIILSVGTGIIVWRRKGGNHASKNEIIIEFEKDEILQKYRTFLESRQRNHSSVEFVDEFEELPLTPKVISVPPPCDMQFEVAFEEMIIFGDLLGSGQFGRVYKGQFKGRRGSEDDGFDERLDVAIKTTKPGQTCRKIVKSFLREIQTHSSMGAHENIVRFVGACSQNLSRGEIYILTEFCEKGSLKAYLKQEISLSSIPSQRTCVDGYVIEKGDEEEGSCQVVQIKMLFGWAEQIANGMDFLHSKNVIHVDLALRNILLTDQLVAKICDFGLSRCCLQFDDSSQSTSLPEQFPLNSIAPECLHIFDKKKVSVSSFTDIWAFGCTAWELFSLGSQPYVGMDIFQIYQMLASRKHLEKPKFAPDIVYAKMVECWNQVPEERPPFSDLRAFFKKLSTETFT